MLIFNILDLFHNFAQQIYSIFFIFVKLKQQKVEYHGFSIKSIS